MNNIKYKSIEKLLLERYIYKNIKTINIPVAYEFTNHSIERKFRHIKDKNGKIIYDNVITKTIDCALSKILVYVYMDKLNINNEIRIFNKYNNLNLIVKLSNINNNIGITIITMMIKKNFIPKKGTYTITINCPIKII